MGGLSKSRKELLPFAGGFFRGLVPSMPEFRQFSDLDQATWKGMLA
jgi:hypothetical protein